MSSRRYLTFDSNTNGFRLCWQNKHVRAEVCGKPIAIVEGFENFSRFRSFSSDDLRLFLNDWFVTSNDWRYVLKALCKTEAEVEAVFEVEDTNDGIYHAQGVHDDGRETLHAGFQGEGAWADFG